MWWRSVFSLLFLGAVAHAGDWEQFSDDNGLKVESRKVDGARVKEIRASGIVEQNIERLFAVLRDVENYPEFMQPTEVVKLLRREGDTKWMYIIINPSWISRRDYCVEITWSRYPDGTMGSKWHQYEEGCPPSPKGIVRDARTEGSWHLRAVDDKRTFVIYQALTDPAGSVPAWMVNRGAAKQMGKMFQSLVERAKLPQYGSR